MFCKNCGKEIEESARFCDGCGANLQGDNIISQNTISKITPIIEDCKVVSKGFFSKEPDSIIDVAKNVNSKVGILLIIVNILLFGFVSCFNLSQVINKFAGSIVSETENFLRGLVGNIAASEALGSLGEFEKVPVLYEFFIPFAAVSLAIFAVIVGGIYLILKVKKQPFASILVILNRIGVASFPMIVALIVNFIVGFVFPYATLYVFVFGVLTSLIFYYECNKEIFRTERPVIEISIVFIMILIVLAIAISIGCNMIGEYITDSLYSLIGGTANDIVDDSITSFLEGLF